jgi:hypothetical protein
MRNLMFRFFAAIIIASTPFNFTLSSPFENYYKKWYFGNQAGMDFFNGNVPVAITNSQLTTYDYGSAICNSAGELLFYTNGMSVWDSSNAVMSNGANLAGNTTGGQTAMILRINSEDNLYYIFTVPEFASAGGFRYSVVDMALNGGLGAVTLKNQLLFAPAAEKMAAVYNQTDNSYWVIAHEWGNANFATYRLSTLGLDTVPVISTVGHINLGGTYGSAHDACGEMSVSPNGNKIACAYNYSATFELYDFDITTGIISNPVPITGVSHIWGIEFSPDSKKLYTTKWTQTEVAQYDLSVYTSAAIAASKIVVGNVPFSGSYACGYLELAPDGKIYIAKWNGTSLSEIGSPDSLGAACGFTNNGFNLAGGISQCGISPSPVFPPNTAGIASPSKLLINIYPNPVINEFTVQISEPWDFKNSVFRITSVDGKTSRTICLFRNETIIYREDLPAGNFVCELLIDGRIIRSKKIILE